MRLTFHLLVYYIVYIVHLSQGSSSVLATQWWNEVPTEFRTADSQAECRV